MHVQDLKASSSNDGLRSFGSWIVLLFKFSNLSIAIIVYRSNVLHAHQSQCMMKLTVVITVGKVTQEIVLSVGNGAQTFKWLGKISFLFNFSHCTSPLRSDPCKSFDAISARQHLRRPTDL